jgi:hypothetical protein
VDAEEFAWADLHVGWEFEAKAGGADVVGLAAEVAGGCGFEDFDGAGLVDAEATAAFDAVVDVGFFESRLSQG